MTSGSPIARSHSGTTADPRRSGARTRRTSAGRLRSTQSECLQRYNGSAFNGRPGTEPRLNHKDHSARPVRCSAGLSRGRAASPFTILDPILVRLKTGQLYHAQNCVRDVLAFHRCDPAVVEFVELLHTIRNGTS